jgi:chorismate mutase
MHIYGGIALIERSQFAHNPRCYVKGGISALKEHGFDGSWLQWFLKEIETFQGEQRAEPGVSREALTAPSQSPSIYEVSLMKACIRLSPILKNF